MRESDLPSPNIGPKGFHLRRVAALAISGLQVVAPRYPNSIHPAATTLKAFFDACSAATNAMIVGAPVNSVAPAITGTAQVGQTLTTTNGTWTGSPTFTRQWRAAGVDIPGATGTTYVPVVGDIGKVISCMVTATNAGGVTTQVSNNTAAVIAA